MKFSFFLVSFLFFTVYLHCQPMESNRAEEIRDKYFIALKSIDKAPKLYAEEFEEIDNTNAIQLAYKGALEAVLTRTTWNLFKKMNYLKLSTKHLNKAVELSPKNIEIRFMRMAVQHEIPSYLGYSENIKEDCNYILSNIENFNSQTLNPQILNEIMRFIYRCERFSQSEILLLKNNIVSNY